MDHLKIERHGGFTGLPARGEVDVDSLSPGDRAAIDALFQRSGPIPASPGADRFIYTVTRTGAAGTKSIDIPEHLVPQSIAALVKEALP